MGRRRKLKSRVALVNKISVGGEYNTGERKTVQGKHLRLFAPEGVVDAKARLTLGCGLSFWIQNQLIEVFLLPLAPVWNLPTHLGGPFVRPTHFSTLQLFLFLFHKVEPVSSQQ